MMLKMRCLLSLYLYAIILRQYLEFCFDFCISTGHFCLTPTRCQKPSQRISYSRRRRFFFAEEYTILNTFSDGICSFFSFYVSFYYGVFILHSIAKKNFVFFSLISFSELSLVAFRIVFAAFIQMRCKK